MYPESTVPWLSRWERRGLVLFGIVFIAFGGLVEFRSAFLSRHMGDLGCYLKAAWAVRTGNDLYEVTDNTWHYNYPPLLAILLVPLADPPPGADTAGMVPFAVSAALVYVFSLVFLFFGVNSLAGALEATSGQAEVRSQPRGCRRWWLLRTTPVLVCLTPIGHTLMRGQVNLLVVALFCATLAAVLRGQRWRAGLWLSGTICIKIYPAFLLLYPLWRRDGRFLGGVALGLLVGLVLIPVAVFGPGRTLAYYEKLTDVLVRPALGAGTDQSRAKELIEVTATDSQSLMAAMHNSLFPNRATRPAHALSHVRLASNLIGGCLTLIALWAAGWRRPQRGPAAIVFFGVLVINMLLLCPVCHLHYFCMAVPLVMGLLAARWERLPEPRVGVGLGLVFTVFVIFSIPGQLPGLDLVRDCGLAMYGALLLWGAGVRFLWQQKRLGASQNCVPGQPLQAAA
jgi:hypothetical protein